MQLAHIRDKIIFIKLFIAVLLLLFFKSIKSDTGLQILKNNNYYFVDIYFIFNVYFKNN